MIAYGVWRVNFSLRGSRYSVGLQAEVEARDAREAVIAAREAIKDALVPEEFMLIYPIRKVEIDA